jgi:hypothetical protein
MKYFLSFLSGLIGPVIIFLMSLIPSESGGMGFVLLFFSPVIIIVNIIVMYILKAIFKEKYSLYSAWLAILIAILYFLITSSIQNGNLAPA